MICPYEVSDIKDNGERELMCAVTSTPCKCHNSKREVEKCIDNIRREIKK